jgi:hypothetical protein
LRVPREAPGELDRRLGQLSLTRARKGPALSPTRGWHHYPSKRGAEAKRLRVAVRESSNPPSGGSCARLFRWNLAVPTMVRTMTLALFPEPEPQT